MPDLQVDLDGLTAFAGRLDGICTALEADGTPAGLDEALGHPELLDASHRFTERWSDGRERIVDNAETLSQMVTESVDAFRQTDLGLASSFDGSGQRMSVGAPGLQAGR